MASENSGDKLIGKLLGTFEILEEIGRGGMATVYRARQLTMNRIVAMKVLPPHLLHDPGFFERFEREVEVISQLEHPHIVPIYEYGQSEGIPYIAMRYLGGGSLETLIRHGTHDLQTLVKPLEQVAQALDYAHQRGIIHRDLKPGNILLDENGNAYLSDFGIARVLGSNMTGSMIIGTPAYMSPEQANGDSLDGRSDIYALGIVLFELITGHEPYRADTPMAILLKHLNEPMPPINEYRGGISPAVEAVISKATAKSPENRYPSVSALVADFNAALDNTHQDATPTLAVSAPELRRELRGAVTPPVSRYAQETAFSKSTTPYPVEGVNEEIHTKSITIAVLGVILLLLVAGGALLASILQPVEIPPVIIPTPFTDAQAVTDSRYTLSVPQTWIPEAGLLDHSDDARLFHIWQSGDSLAFTTVALSETYTDDFEAQIAAYTADYYEDQPVQRIDEATAEDGTVRHSYWITETDRFAAGQLDVFYRQHAGQLAVLELYSAASTENTLVPTLQAILDSWRVTGA